MRKKRTILLTGLLLAGLVAVLWKPLHLGEPWYHWRPLSIWLEEYGAGPRGYKPSPEADEALRHIGAKAVPHLLRRLHATSSNAIGASVPISASSPPTFGTTKTSVKDRLMSWVEKHTPVRFHRNRIRAPASWDHWQAYLGFQALGPLGKAAIPDLVKLAHDPSGTSLYPNVQQMKDIKLVAASAKSSTNYVAVGESPSKFRSTDSFLVEGEIAAWSLAAIGAESVPPLLTLLADPSPRLRSRAAEALGLMGAAAEPAVPVLVRSLKDPDLDFRIRAADALGWIGKQPALAVPALTEALNDPAMGVKYYAANSLGHFREHATGAIPTLLVNFAASDYRIKQSAAQALSKISRETTASTILPVVLRDLKDPRRNNGALLTLGQMKIEPDLVIPAIIEATDDTNKMVRANAIHLLGEFGPQAKAAVPKLVSLKADPDSDVRERAAHALEKIDPGRHRPE